MLTIDANVWVSALDSTDAFHVPSQEFLNCAVKQMIPLTAPSLVIVETGCTLARRSRSPERGRRAAQNLTFFPLLRLEPVDASLEREALIIGTNLHLRAADALYAAVAARTGSSLITTDRELGRRTQGYIEAFTPQEWLIRQRT